MRDPLINFAGWMFIMLRKPFVVGDRIQIGEHRGDVIDTRIFQFTMVEIGNWVDSDQSTGRIIHIPNGWVFNHSTANYSQGFAFIWNELPIIITFESNWEKAKKILTAVVKEHSRIPTHQCRGRSHQGSAPVYDILSAPHAHRLDIGCRIGCDTDRPLHLQAESASLVGNENLGRHSPEFR